MTDIDSAASDVVETLADNDINVDESDIVERLEPLVNQYAVPIAEAKRSTLRHYADEHDTDIDGLGGGSSGGTENATVEEITNEDQWVNVEVKVAQLWDSDSDSVKQTGLVADETGRIKFTAWSESDLPLLEDDATYRLENVVTDSYQGRMSIQLNSSTEITKLDKDIDAVEQETTQVYGALVSVQSGSGLIKRCTATDCTRVIQNGRCSEHGKVDGEFDLRIKAVLDTGLEIQEVIFDDEATTELTGTTLEEAKAHAKDALDTTVVGEEMAEQVMGRYYVVEGPQVGQYVLADDFHEMPAPDPTETLAQLEDLR